VLPLDCEVAGLVLGLDGVGIFHTLLSHIQWVCQGRFMAVQGVSVTDVQACPLDRQVIGGVAGTAGDPFSEESQQGGGGGEEVEAAGVEVVHTVVGRFTP